MTAYSNTHQDKVDNLRNGIGKNEDYDLNAVSACPPTVFACLLGLFFLLLPFYLTLYMLLNLFPSSHSYTPCSNCIMALFPFAA